ncbi:hypothetical protein [Amycolatopsis japonica]
MSTYTAGTATLDLVPSMKDFHRKVEKDLKGYNPQVLIGVDTTQAVRGITQLARQTPTIDVDVRVRNAQSAVAKAIKDVEAAEQGLAATRVQSEDAARKVDIAEKQLDETRSKANAKASQIAQGELKVSQARRAAAAAVNDARNAEAKLLSARTTKSQKDRDLFDAGNMVGNVQGAIRQVTDLGDTAASVGSLFGGMGVKGAAGIGQIAGTASSAAGPVGALVAAGAGIAIIGGGASVAAAGLIGLANAALTASGALGLIPGGLAVGGSVLGTFAVGTLGVTDAIDALGSAQASAGKDAQDFAKRQRNAAESVQAAQISLSRAVDDAATARSQASDRVLDAVEQQRRTEVEAARAVIQADRQVIAAERDRDRALDDLAQSIRDAEKAQRDLNLQVRGGALDAEEAVLDLTEAQRDFTNAQQSGLDGDALKRYEIALKRAQLRVDETTASNGDLTEQQKEYAKAGVKANEQVISATESVRRAEESLTEARDSAAQQRVQSAQQVADAEEAVADAEQQMNQTAIQAQRSIADAERALASARANARDSLNQMSAAQQAAADAMDGLSPKAQAFVREVLALKPAWDEVKNSIQDALFNGLDGKLQQLADTYLPIVKQRLTDIAAEANTAAGEIVKLLTDPKNAGSVDKILETTADIVGKLDDVLGPLVQAFLDLAEVGSDVLDEDLLPVLTEVSEKFADWIRDMKDSGQLRDWMSGAVELLSDIIKFSISAGEALVNIITSLNTGVEKSGFFDKLGQMVQDFIAFANSDEGKKFFENLGQTIGDIGTFVLKVLEFVGTVMEFWNQIDEGTRKATDGATGFFEVLFRIFLAMQTLGLSEALIALFTIDWEKVKDWFTHGTGEVVGRILLALATGGVSEAIRAVFSIDWGALGQWFVESTSNVFARVALAISTFGLSEILRIAFSVDWVQVTKDLIAGIGEAMSKVGKILRDNPIGRFLFGDNFSEGIEQIVPWGSFNPMGRADGGYIAGPGTGRSDSIPAWLSNGEFVVNAESTKRNRSVLEWLNARRFADGGVVGSSPAPSAMSGTASMVTIDVAAVASLGDVAASVTDAVAALNAELALLVMDAVAYWAQILASTVSTADQITNRQTLLTQFYVTSWATMTAAVWGSVNGQNQAFAALITGLGNARNAMQYTADWAVSQYGRIRAAAADPIRWVIQQPINAGLITAWNALDTQFALGKHVDPIPLAFATGGKVPGVGNSDTVKARLTPGEYVLSKRAIANLGGLAAVDRLHKMARAGIIGPDANLGRQHGDGKRRMDLMRTVPLDGLGFKFGGVQPHVAFAGEEIERIFGRLPGGIGGVGSRPNASDHPAGLALDFMTLQDQGLGDRIAGYLQQNAPRLLVKYLIWKQRINDGSGWDPMEDRGSITANHFDHVHTSFLRAGQAGRAFSDGGGFLFDPASVVGEAFKAAVSMAGETSTRWPGNLLAAQSGAIAGQAIEGTKANAVARLTAMMSAGMPNVHYDGNVAKTILEVAKALGFSRRGAEVALAAGLQESGLRNLTYGDRDSLGVFQQRPSQGWGTPAQILNPVYAATKFFEALRGIPGWESLPHTVAAQRVQRSGFPDAYAKWVPQAIQIVNGSGLFDAGGIATGAGFLPKKTLEPERVLSPAQTRAFEAALSRLGRDGYAPTVSGPETAPVQVTNNVYPSPGMDERAVATDVSRRTVFKLRSK